MLSACLNGLPAAYGAFGEVMQISKIVILQEGIDVGSVLGMAREGLVTAWIHRTVAYRL
jgi:hypothetical protein